MQRPHPKNAPRVVTVDVVTGVEFTSTTENHYEANDGVPHAPPVDLPRKTLRERVEDLMYRGGGFIPPLRHDGSNDADFDVDDPNEIEDNGPMTEAELRYVYTEEEAEAQRARQEAHRAAQQAPKAVPPADGQNASAGSASPSPSPQPTPQPPAPKL